MNIKRILTAFTLGSSLLAANSVFAQSSEEVMIEKCPTTYSRSDCSKVPGIVLSSRTNPNGIVEISCEGMFAITSCSANADSSSYMYKHWQGLARCVPFSALQENCSAARVGDYNASAPVIKIVCPAHSHADCDWGEEEKCSCVED